MLTYRKERKVRPRRIVIMQAAALGSMIAFSMVTQRPPGPGAWVALLAVGITGGLAYGRLVDVRSGEKGITMSYTLPWLVVWGALMAATQLTAVLAQSVPVLIYSLAIFNLGANLGMNGRIVGSYRELSSGAVAALLGFAAVGLVAVAEPGSAFADAPSPTGDLPPGIQSAVVLSGGTMANDDDDWLRAPSLDSWDAFGGHGDEILTGPYIQLRYSVDDVPAMELVEYDSEEVLEPTSVDCDVTVRWFSSASEAERVFAFETSERDYEEPEDGSLQTYFPGGPVDIGLGWPTYRSGVGISSLGLSSYTVQRGSVIVSWSTFGGGYNPNSPGELGGAEHLAAIVASVQEVDVDALRADWYGFDGVGAGVPPGDAGDRGDENSITPGDSGSDLTASAGADDTETAPVEPGQAAAATALAGVILAGGSLLQLGDRLDVESIRAGLDALRGSAPADPLADVLRSEDGRVFVEMPWDEGGPAWVSEADARHAITMQSDGYRWDQRWGWVRGDEAAERQGNADLSRDEWLQRDRVADTIVADIMGSREQLAETLAEMDRTERIEAIRDLESQAMIDNWLARVADNRYHWWQGVSIAADAGFTLATGGLSAVKPLGQLAIRGGMHMTTGYTQAWSENELAGRTWDRQAFARGSTIGVVKTALDFGIEGGLNAARAAMPAARAAWSGLRGTGEVGEHLNRAKELLSEAVSGVEQVAVREGLEEGFKVVDSDAALELLREGRRLRANSSSLAELEAAGAVSRTEARLIRQVWTETFDESAEAGAKEVFEVFEQRYGDGLREVLLGDQGSSATRFAVGSLKTDADRTVLPVFKQELLERISRETGETLEQVNLRLTDEVTAMWREGTEGSLQARGLTLEDFDAGSYSDFGRSATADDAFNANWVKQRQGEGTTIVVRPGDAATYRSSGQTIVDQSNLNADLAGAADGTLSAARVNTDSALTFMRDQAEVVARAADVKTAAKGLARQAWASGRSDIVELAGTSPDPALRGLVDAIIKEPQDQARLLREAGYTPEGFLQAVKAESERLLDALGPAH